MITNMIVQSLTGVIYPHMSYSQLPSYSMQPNRYVSDLRAIVMSDEHGKALASRMVTEAKEGQQFVDKAAAVATWYTPPKGHLVDTYV